MSKEIAVIIKGQFPPQFSECGVIQLCHFAVGQQFIILQSWKEMART